LFRFKGRLLSSDDPDAATAAFERAVATAREQNAKLLELQACTRLGEHQLRLGEPRDILERVAALCECFGADEQLAEVARARTLLASEAIAQ
jgi:hypothetical protein